MLETQLGIAVAAAAVAAAKVVAVAVSRLAVGCGIVAERTKRGKIKYDVKKSFFVDSANVLQIMP